MLNTAQITALRAQQALALPDTVVIQRRTLASDGAGGPTETWAALATVAGRLSADNRAAREAAAAGRLTTSTPYRVTLPAETAVASADRLVIGVRTFEVNQVMAGGAWETARVCLCVEIV